MNECEGVNGCHENAMCSNTDGSYECTCHQGYTGDGRQCEGKNIKMYAYERSVRLEGKATIRMAPK